MDKENLTNYHNPVMLQESIEALAIRPDGVYVDVTMGGGGHTRAILARLGANGRLFSFDQDADAAQNCPVDERFRFMPFNFRHLQRSLRLEGVRQVDGILADLGVSSYQFDEPTRGFSHRFDAQLDMRMNTQEARTARHILQTYTAEELQRVFGEYGEVRNARTLAQAIVQQRDQKALRTTAEFLYFLGPLIKGERHRYLAQVFQALRIEVNDEMGALREFLQQTVDMLAPKGRLVVLSYHSLEDRLVKNWILHGTFDDEPVKDFYGNIQTPFIPVSRKPILPSKTEMEQNTRAHSAKMRVAERK